MLLLYRRSSQTYSILVDHLLIKMYTGAYNLGSSSCVGNKYIIGKRQYLFNILKYNKYKPAY
jgi:hypothetical protein